VLHRERGGGSGVSSAITLNGALLGRNVLDSCLKSLHYFSTDNISFETSFHCFLTIVRFKIEGRYEKFLKI